MTSGRKKPSAAFWAIVLMVAVPVLYVLSFGPAMWLFWSKWAFAGYYEVLRFIYAPIFYLIAHGPETISQALTRYGDWFR
jgi:hypothetical protein